MSIFFETDNIQEDTLLLEFNNYLNIINTLSNEQQSFKKFSKDWIDIEQRIVEAECMLMNVLILFQMQRNVKTNFDFDERNLAAEQLQLVPIVGLHLNKYFENEYFKAIINNTLSPSARTLIERMVEQFKKANVM
jgi:hypothetical protein